MKFLPVGADIWVGEHLCFFRTFTGTQGQTAQAKVLRFGGTGAPGGGSILLGCCAVIHKKATFSQPTYRDNVK